MKAGIKYSIIIPHFNNEDGLTRLLSSIPKRDDIEVLVVDDRSQGKGFIDVVKNSGLINISWFINDSVKSAGACRNIGIENSTGEYLVFADSDDYFTEDAFLIIDDAVSACPDADILYCMTTSSDDDGNLTTRHLNTCALVRDYLDNRGHDSELRLRLKHYVPWGKAIKRDLVVKNKIYFDQTIIANDGVFSLKVGKSARKIFGVDREIYCVTSSASSLTARKDVDKFRVRLEVYVRFYGMLTNSERQVISTSPLPLLWLSLDYGIPEFIRSIIYLKKNKVALLKFYRPSMKHAVKLFG